MPRLIETSFQLNALTNGDAANDSWSENVYANCDFFVAVT